MQKKETNMISLLLNDFESIKVMKWDDSALINLYVYATFLLPICPAVKSYTTILKNENFIVLNLT